MNDIKFKQVYFRRICFAIIIVLITAKIGLSQSKVLQPRVDERVELLSIVFRLAGAKEYSRTKIIEYSYAIDNYFSQYKNDELIRFTKHVRQKNDIGYDAVMNLAVMIDIDNGRIRLNSTIQKECMDRRWGDYYETFITLLDSFYRRTNFHKFYNDNEKLYSIVEERFEEVTKEIDIDWLENFFGEEKNSYMLYIMLASTGGNYGPGIKFQNGEEYVYSIISPTTIDSSGIPTFSTSYYKRIIIHELCHSFCNHLVDKYSLETTEATARIYKSVKEKMRIQAYGAALTMEYETLVRASVIRYELNHSSDPNIKGKLILYEKSKGFIIVEPIVNILDKYETDSIQYKSLNDFMPEIVKIYNSITEDDLDRLNRKEPCEGPQIVSCSIKNDSEDINPDVKQLVVTFDRPMSNGAGINNGKGGNKTYPEITSIKWNENKNNELIISFNLLPEKKYSMKLRARYFFDESYCNMERDFVITFKTRKSD